MQKKRIIFFGVIIILIISIGLYISTQISNAATVKNEFAFGNTYYNEQEYEEAIIAFEKVLVIDEKHVEARVMLGESYVALDQTEEAREVFVKGIEVVPDEPVFYLALSDVEVADEQIEDAIIVLDKGFSETQDEEIEEELEEIASKLRIVADDRVKVCRDLELRLVYDGGALGDTDDKVIEDSEEIEESDESEESDDLDLDQKNDAADEDEEILDNDAGISSATDDADEGEAVEGRKVVRGQWSLEEDSTAVLSDAEGDRSILRASEIGREVVMVTLGSIDLTHEVTIEDVELFEVRCPYEEDAAEALTTEEAEEITTDVLGRIEDTLQEFPYILYELTSDELTAMRTEGTEEYAMVFDWYEEALKPHIAASERKEIIEYEIEHLVIDLGLVKNDPKVRFEIIEQGKDEFVARYLLFGYIDTAFQSGHHIIHFEKEDGAWKFKQDKLYYWWDFIESDLDHGWQFHTSSFSEYVPGSYGLTFSDVEKYYEEKAESPQYIDQVEVDGKSVIIFKLNDWYEGIEVDSGFFSGAAYELYN